MDNTEELPIAFNVSRVREAMLTGIIVPREIVNKAFSELNNQLEAEQTKFFTHKGHITGKVNVADNGARLQAIDQTLSLAGLFKPDDRRGSGNSNNPGVAIEVSKDGVIRIAVGQPFPAINSPVTPVELNSIEREPTAIPSSSGGSTPLTDKDDPINRFNTILDELVDE